MPGNAVSGTLPEAFGELDSLSALLLNSNDLEGSMPKQIMQSPSLQLLRLVSIAAAKGFSHLGRWPSSFADVSGVVASAPPFQYSAALGVGIFMARGQQCK